ncbi:MAG: hypothetical protein IJF88_09120 [Oscillospiraceae bacterium]|nr:hypothetical protein [Oscillospiraceae bacterium]
MMKTEKLNLTQEWDKTFPKSDKVNHSYGAKQARERKGLTRLIDRNSENDRRRNFK